MHLSDEMEAYLLANKEPIQKIHERADHSKFRYAKGNKKVNAFRRSSFTVATSKLPEVKKPWRETVAKPVQTVVSESEDKVLAHNQSSTMISQPDETETPFKAKLMRKMTQIGASLKHAETTF